MKITVNKTVKEEIELPLYFEKNNRFCKIISENYYLSVYPENFDDGLMIEPGIDVNPVLTLYSATIRQITKAEFDLAFLKAEKILNELRNA